MVSALSQYDRTVLESFKSHANTREANPGSPSHPDMRRPARRPAQIENDQSIGRTNQPPSIAIETRNALHSKEVKGHQGSAGVAHLGSCEGQDSMSNKQHWGSLQMIVLLQFSNHPNFWILANPTLWGWASHASTPWGNQNSRRPTHPLRPRASCSLRLLYMGFSLDEYLHRVAVSRAGQSCTNGLPWLFDLCRRSGAQAYT